MTVIGVGFIGTCLIAISQGGVGPLSIVGILFGLATLLVGIFQWRENRADQHADDERASKQFMITLMGSSVLLGLVSLVMLLLTLTDWAQFNFATHAMFPRPVAVGAGVLGTVLFLGGPVALLLRKGRAFGQKEPDDDD